MIPTTCPVFPRYRQFCVPSVFLDKDHSLKPSYGVTINSCVARPSSRGTIRLASANPAQQALIDPKYLSEPEDLRLSMQGVRRAREILAQEPLRSMVDREIFPGPGVDSDEELTVHVRALREDGLPSRRDLPHGPGK